MVFIFLKLTDGFIFQFFFCPRPPVAKASTEFLIFNGIFKLIYVSLPGAVAVAVAIKVTVAVAVAVAVAIMVSVSVVEVVTGLGGSEHTARLAFGLIDEMMNAE